MTSVVNKKRPSKVKTSEDVTYWHVTQGKKSAIFKIQVYKKNEKII